MKNRGVFGFCRGVGASKLMRSTRLAVASTALAAIASFKRNATSVQSAQLEINVPFA